jgi:hypothetical protein
MFLIASQFELNKDATLSTKEFAVQKSKEARRLRAAKT